MELDAEGMPDTAIEEIDKVFVSTELGGGGNTTAETVAVAVAETGVRDLLAHFGVIDAKPATRESVVYRTGTSGVVIGRTQPSRSVYAS